MPLQFCKFRILPLLIVYFETCHYYFSSTWLVPFSTLPATLAHLQTVFYVLSRLHGSGSTDKAEPTLRSLVHSLAYAKHTAGRRPSRPPPPLHRLLQQSSAMKEALTFSTMLHTASLSLLLFRRKTPFMASNMEAVP